MEGVYLLILRYLETGGITMYPLVLCCFWMWLLILFHLPLWRPSLQTLLQQVGTEYDGKRRERLRHDKQLYDYLLHKQYRETERGLSTIKVLAAIAPFLGLFGTVSGMINTFDSVACFGLGNPKSLAAGISEAMITTQFGLLIALPGILAYFFLQRRVHRDRRKLRVLLEGYFLTGKD